MSRLTGSTLIAALERTRLPIKLQCDGLPDFQVSPEQALALCRVSTHAGKARKNGTITSIREIDTRRPNFYEPCWRNQDAAALQPNAVTGQYIV